MGFSEIFERKRFPGDFHLDLNLYKRKNKRIGMPADEEFRGRVIFYDKASAGKDQGPIPWKEPRAEVLVYRA